MKTTGVKVFAGLGLLLAVLSKQGGGTGRTPDPVTVTSIPAGGSYTPRSWAKTFLGALGDPETSCNINAIEAWASAEGGAWGGDGATANPLNTTQREPGSWSINSVGVQAFSSWQEGLQANVTVINNGRYGGILSALRAGDSAQEVADEVTDSPWGTGEFSANC